MEDKKPKDSTQPVTAPPATPSSAPTSPPASAEPAEFASKHVRSNIAPIFFIIQSEQLILQRTDQKAFTLMSLLGVFMVFFIVHFPKVIAADNFNYLSGLMVFLYFISATLGLINFCLLYTSPSPRDRG